MYKKLIQFHIGLQVRSMIMNINMNYHEQNTPIKGSFPKPEQIDYMIYRIHKFLKYLQGEACDTKIAKIIHQMKTYRSILSIYFF